MENIIKNNEAFIISTIEKFEEIIKQYNLSMPKSFWNAFEGNTCMYFYTDRKKPYFTSKNKALEIGLKLT